LERGEYALFALCVVKNGWSLEGERETWKGAKSEVIYVIPRQSYLPKKTAEEAKGVWGKGRPSFHSARPKGGTERG